MSYPIRQVCIMVILQPWHAPCLVLRRECCGSFAAPTTRTLGTVILMDTDTPTILTAMVPGPVDAKRNAMRLALILLALMGMLAWNGLLILSVGRLLLLR
jgi:hypothetical protein